MRTRANHEKRGFFFLAATTCLMLASLPAVADPTYTPPPLFGGSSVIVESAPIAAPISLAPHDNAALVESASLAERVQNPVQDHAPISVDTLLNHPADRVAQNAQDVLNALPVDDMASAGIPDLLPYDLATEPSKPIKDLSIPTTATRAKPESLKKNLVARSTPKRKPEISLAQTNPTRDDVNTHARAVLEPITMEELTLGTPTQEQTTTTSAPPPLFNTPIAQIEPASGDSKKDAAPRTMTDPFIAFSAEATDLTPAQKAQITSILGTLSPQTRLEIRAYIPPKTKDGQRLALGRGLTVRQFLKDQGAIPHHLILRVVAPESPADWDHHVALHIVRDAGL